MSVPHATPDVPTVVLRDHLSEGALRKAFASLHLPSSPGPVLIDCRDMTGYDLDARHAFVDWSRTHGSTVSRIAIVTDNRVWWMVIGAMSLASGRSMKGFETSEQALAWARSG